MYINMEIIYNQLTLTKLNKSMLLLDKCRFSDLMNDLDECLDSYLKYDMTSWNDGEITYSNVPHSILIKVIDIIDQNENNRNYIKIESTKQIVIKKLYP